MLSAWACLALCQASGQIDANALKHEGKRLFSDVQLALLEIAKQVKELDEIRTWTDTIRSNGEKILGRLRISTEKLEKQGQVLTERVADLKEAMKKG